MTTSLSSTEGEPRNGRDVDHSSARFEFRAWGDLRSARDRMLRIGSADGTRRDRDRYLLGPDPVVNAKIRNGRIEVKHLVETTAGLQRWHPAWMAERPYEAGAVRRLVHELGAEPSPDISSGAADGEELVDLLRRHGLDSSAVDKHRTHFDLGEARGEVASVKVGDTDTILHSVAIEGLDPRRLIELRAVLGLASSENIAVHRAVARALAGA